MRVAGEVLFLVCVALYLAAAGFHFLHFFFRQGGRVAWGLTALAWAAHTGAVAALFLAGRQPPLATVRDAALFLGWATTLNYLLVERLFRLQVAGTFVVPAVTLLLLYAGALPREGGLPAEVAGQLWVVVHAVVALGGYGAFALACAAGVMYLLQERQLRHKAFRLFYHRLPSLETLDGLAFRLVVFGFPLLVLAVTTGSLWARRLWGEPWFADPKVPWSLLTLAVYAVYIAVRARYGWRGRRPAYLAVAGFGLVLLNLVVANVLSPHHGF